MMKFTRKLASATIGVSLFLTGAASAHVAVKPATVGVGVYQTFTVGVPVEKDVPTIGLRLVIPEGVTAVSPNVKPGWTIETKKTGEGESAAVTEIIWTQGVIPSGQRDDFLFSAKTPSKATTLRWKAYQTYQDGEIVAWEDAPVDKHDDSKTDDNTSEPKPYSQTKVVNDLAAAATTTDDADHSDEMAAQDDVTRAVSFAALGVAVLSLIMVSRSRAATPPKK